MPGRARRTAAAAVLERSDLGRVLRSPVEAWTFDPATPGIPCSIISGRSPARLRPRGQAAGRRRGRGAPPYVKKVRKDSGPLVGRLILRPARATG